MDYYEPEESNEEKAEKVNLKINLKG